MHIICAQNNCGLHLCSITGFRKKNSDGPTYGAIMRKQDSSGEAETLAHWWVVLPIFLNAQVNQHNTHTHMQSASQSLSRHSQLAKTHPEVAHLTPHCYFPGYVMPRREGYAWLHTPTHIFPTPDPPRLKPVSIRLAELGWLCHTWHSEIHSGVPATVSVGWSSPARDGCISCRIGGVECEGDGGQERP